MKKVFVLAVFFLFNGLFARAQEFGLSFSYFIPKDGYFSTPISPFSIRGLGLNFNQYLSLETGATLYRMSGLNLKDLEIKSKEPLIGPNFTVLVPAELVFRIGGSKVQLGVKGGGFFFYGFGHKINYGNFDRALRTHESWTVANASLNFDNNPGFGWHCGGELTVYVTKQIGISIETNYLSGQANFPLTGSYTGGTSDGLLTLQADYPDAKIDFTGLEFSAGVFYNTGTGRKGAGKKRR